MRLGTRNEHWRMRGEMASNVNDSTTWVVDGWKLAKRRFTETVSSVEGRSRLFVRGKQRPSNRASAPSSSLSTVVAFRSSLPATFATPRIDVHPSVANWKLNSAKSRTGRGGISLYGREIVYRIVLIFTDIEIFR